MDKYLECPDCGGVSSAREWDNATKRVYGKVYSIMSDSSEYCVFVCPKCGDRNVSGFYIKTYQTGIPVKVKKLHPDAVIPQYAHEGDAGFDLVSIKDVTIAPGQTVAVPTGLAFQIPTGYEIQVRPRSGLVLKTNLRVANSPGTIDSGYRGDVKVLISNTHSTTNKPYTILKGDKIAQGVLQKVPQANFIEVNELNDSERGSGRFGSTGLNINA